MLCQFKNLRCFPLVIFNCLIACKPPGINQRTIHPPHVFYVEQLAQRASIKNSKPQAIFAKRPEEIGITGLPESCLAEKENQLLCIECKDDPIPLKRCKKGFDRNFSPEKNCRFTNTALKCLDPKTKQSLLVQLRNNQESRFLVQFDMILETLDNIFYNEIKNDKSLNHARNVLSLVGESKANLFQNDKLEDVPLKPTVLKLLSRLDEKEQALILQKLNQGYSHLQNRRLAGQLSTEDAMQFLVELFEASKTDKKIISIVKSIDLQGLDSL